MRTIRQNIEDWLHCEAYVRRGHPFKLGTYSCVPVASETDEEEETPVGFLVTQGADVAFIESQTPEGEQIMSAWMKNHLLEGISKKQALPAEYWYG